MYVCLYACMYVRMYVCTYVCVYVCTDFTRLYVCMCVYSFSAAQSDVYYNSQRFHLYVSSTASIFHLHSSEYFIIIK